MCNILSNISLTAVEPIWLDFLVASLDVDGAGTEEVLPSLSFLSLSRVVDWDREREVRTCEVLLCILAWETSSSMGSSVEEPWLPDFRCPGWFGLALAASLTRALSNVWGDSRVMVTFGS